MKTKINKKVILITIFILVVLLIGAIILYLNSSIMKADDSLKAKEEKEFGNYSDGYYHSFTQEEHLVHDEQGHEFVDNEISFSVKEGTSKKTVEELATQFNAVISSYIPPCCYKFRFNEKYTFEELVQLQNELKTFDFVRYVDNIDRRYTKVTPDVIPDDVKWDSWDEENPDGNNWGLEVIRAPSAWKHIKSINAVNVGVYDNMFALEHEDLQFLNYPPFNPNLEDMNINEDTHGTHVTGTISATFNNNLGISGVSPKNNIYGMTTQAIETVDDWEIALFYLIKDKRCKVINISLTPNLLGFAASRNNKKALDDIKRMSSEIESVLSMLIDEGYEFVICKSAGNQWETDYNSTSKDYRYSKDENSQYGYVQDDNGTECGNINAKYNPLSYIKNENVKSRIIVVGAIQNDGSNQYSLANFSQRGERVDVTAPGVDIYSTSFTEDFLGRKKNAYEMKSGTSMATPHVSGLASMLFGINPQLTGKQVKDIICETSNKDIFNLIDASKAVETARTLGSISGKVRDVETKKFLKADIRIYSDGKLCKTITSSSDTGKFSVFLPAGTYDIVISKKGYNKDKITISLKEKQMYIIDEPFELKSKESALKELLLSTYWENSIQSPHLYKFNDDGTLDEYYIVPSDINTDDAVFNRSLNYELDNDTLVISDWGIKLKYVTLKDNINWDKGLHLEEKISDSEHFFYEINYANPSHSPDNAMYLQKSNRSVTFKTIVNPRKGESINTFIVGTWIEKDFSTSHKFTFYEDMTYTCVIGKQNTQIENGQYRFINSSTIYLYPSPGSLPIVIRYHPKNGALEIYVDRYFYKIIS